ncbi:MAG: FHA domain-containing protein [Rhodanobacteraceae bacterium]
MAHRAIDPSDSRADLPRVELRYRGQLLQLDASSPPCSLGRRDDCSLMMEFERVARQHALIEYARGYCMIRDHSTNGTCLTLGDDSEPYIHRETMRLVRHGTISLGSSAATNPDHLVSFRCVV